MTTTRTLKLQTAAQLSVIIDRHIKPLSIVKRQERMLVCEGSVSVDFPSIQQVNDAWNNVQNQLVFEYKESHLLELVSHAGQLKTESTTSMSPIMAQNFESTSPTSHSANPHKRKRSTSCDNLEPPAKQTTLHKSLD